jgi:hypothetical protein
MSEELRNIEYAEHIREALRALRFDQNLAFK